MANSLTPLQRLMRARRFRDFAITSQSQRVAALVFRVSQALVNREIGWVRSLEPDPDPNDLFRVVDLLPSFGQGNKPLAQLTCKDVHPCRNCSGLGFVLDVVDFLFRTEAGDPVYYVDCSECDGSGIGRLKRSYESMLRGVLQIGEGQSPSASTLAIAGARRGGWRAYHI